MVLAEEDDVTQEGEDVDGEDDLSHREAEDDDEDDHDDEEEEDDDDAIKLDVVMSEGDISEADSTSDDDEVVEVRKERSEGDKGKGTAKKAPPKTKQKRAKRNEVDVSFDFSDPREDHFFGIRSLMKDLGDQVRCCSMYRASLGEV